MSRKAQGKGRSRGLDPEEFKKLADGGQLSGLLSAHNREESTRKQLTGGLSSLPPLEKKASPNQHHT